MRVPGPAGGDVHRRRRLLVPHRRDRDGGALEDELGDGGEQQLRGNQSKRGFDRVYGGKQTEQALELWHLQQGQLREIAEDMGAIGIRVEKPSELGPAIEKALKADRPVIIDVVTDIDALAPLAVS